jgi:hypothetical protein
MRIGRRRANRAGKKSIDELRNACLPRALALPLICRISARPIGSSPIEITPIAVFLKEPETSVFGTNRPLKVRQGMSALPRYFRHQLVPAIARASSTSMPRYERAFDLGVAEQKLDSPVGLLMVTASSARSAGAN